MNKICEYLDAIFGDVEKEESLKAVISEVMHCLERLDKQAYEKHLCALHSVACGVHFDEELAVKAVDMMKNADGTSGAYWSLAETNSLAQKLHIDEKADWYYVLNMMHSDYSKIIGDDDDKYVDMALAYINDVDGCDGKVFKTWLATR